MCLYYLPQKRASIVPLFVSILSVEISAKTGHIFTKTSKEYIYIKYPENCIKNANKKSYLM